MMLCLGQVVADVSKERSAFIFGVKQIKENILPGAV
jgi:hypothetical protein